jgi:hypothetical protein
MAFLGDTSSDEVNIGSAAVIKLAGMRVFYDHNTTKVENENFLLFFVGDLRLPSIEKVNEIWLENAQGVFSYLLYNKSDKHIIVGTDKLGFHPFYYSETDKLVFGNFLPHVKQRMQSPQVNWDAWDEILNGGDILGLKSTIVDVLRLKYGQKLQIRDAKIIKKIEFWQFRTPEYIKSAQFIKENNVELYKAMLERVPENKNLTIPLTGGDDSRRLAIIADQLDCNVNSLTQETSSKDLIDRDSPVAKVIAEKLGVSHRVLSKPNNPQLQQDMIVKDYWCGFESHQHAWAVNIDREITGGQYIVDGICGDITVNNHYLWQWPEYANDYPSHVVAEKIHQDGELFSVDNSFISNSHLERIFEELNLFEPGANQLNLFKLFNHTRRNTAAWFYPFLVNANKMILPYASENFLHHSLSLTPTERLNHRFQRKCSAKLNPEVASLISTRDDFDFNYWRDVIGAKHVEPMPYYSKHVKISSEAKNFVKSTFFDNLKDYIAFNSNNDKLYHKRVWRIEPMQRLSLFLDWLKTDDSDTPVLNSQVPMFIQNVLAKIK